MIATRLTLLLALFLMQAVAERSLLPLLDFAGPEVATKWQALNDGVMGGISDGRFRITPDKTLEFFGTLSLENNGGFASVRTTPMDFNRRLRRLPRKRGPGAKDADTVSPYVQADAADRNGAGPAAPDPGGPVIR
jgi:hypothetical protein